MNRRCTRLAVVVVMAVGLSACATDSGRTKAEGTAVGAGAGAAVGATLGAIFGGGRGAAIGAGIGAGVGAAAGYAYGSHVAHKKAEYARREDWLNDCIASARQVNNETREYNAQLAADVDRLDRETDNLARAYAQRRVRREALEDEKVKVETRLAEVNERLKRVRWELENQQQVLADTRRVGDAAHSAALEAEIKALRAQIAELETHSESLASISGRMAV